MALVSPAELMQEARDGRLLSAPERRHALSWFLNTQEEAKEMPNQEIAKIFAVTERTIRVDKMKIRAKIVRELEETRGTDLLVADILTEFNKQLKDMEKSKKKVDEGRELYLKHCVAIIDTRLKIVKTLQDLGWVQKQGITVTDQTEYIAVIGQDGNVESKKLKRTVETTQELAEGGTPVLMGRNETNEIPQYSAVLTASSFGNDKVN
jgi:hypothetical protein